MNIKLQLNITFLLVFVIQVGMSQQSSKDIKAITYEAVDQDLYDAIVAMDKIYFDAYNACDMEKQASMYSEDLEFFHDKGGLTTSKKDLLASIEENICGKVTRTLVEGSLEVYPIKDYGAVEIGYHKFFNSREPNAVSKPVKFIMIWKKEEASWLITKVISLH